MNIITPQRLYHGTTDQFVQSFQKKLLNAQYWRPGRDFGEGFYTTISAEQARKWAVQGAAKHIQEVHPCVLEIELHTVPLRMEPLVFLSDSFQWAKFIFEHRNAMKKGQDPCTSHPDIIIGPMADNDTGKIMNECVHLNKDVHWFYDQITRSMRGRRLDPMRLGNQVVFSSEHWNQSLRLIGYHVQNKGRWSYYDCTSTVESI